MAKRKFISGLFLILFTLTGLVSAQTTKEEFLSDSRFAGGLYCPYPVTSLLPAPTPAPAGYTPFYISHYGRHGSRYAISASCHTGPIKILTEAGNAGKLTPAGKSLLQRLQLAAEDAEARYGDLSPLGAKEQKGIAERMFLAYPEVFAGKGFVYSRSTQVPRCILSMAAFDERLKELNPDLTIAREASMRNHYLNNDAVVNRDTIKALQSLFAKKQLHPERFLANLFTDPAYARQLVAEPEKLMSQVYIAAINLPNLDHLQLSLFDAFTSDELFVLWQYENMWMYYFVGPSAINGTSTTRSASLLLKNILDCADDAIRNHSVAADLRFGHDSYIIPLLAIMDVEGMNNRESEPENVYLAWSSFKAAPMAANIQLVFYKNNSNNDILVKLMHCEKPVRVPVATDMFPFYHWKDLRAYYEKKVSE
jgi:hypothetical protein